MASQFVRNRYNQSIGRIDNNPDGANAYHFQCGLVGFYKKNMNRTYYPDGSVFGDGNQSSALIFEAENG